MTASPALPATDRADPNDRDAARGSRWRRFGPFAVARTRGQWISDAFAWALAMVCWLYFLITGPPYFEAVPAAFWYVDGGLGLIAVVALLWARRFPVAVALIAVIPGALALTAGFAALASVYRMASTAKPLTSAIVTVLHLAAALPYHWLFPLPGMPVLMWLVVIPLLYLLCLSFGLLTRSRRLLIEKIRGEAELERKGYEAQLRDIRRDERERIAREMHDVLAHRISLLSVHAGALEYRSRDMDADGGNRVSASELHDAASVIRDNAHLAIEDLRTLLSILREDDEAESALGTARPMPKLDDIRGLVEEATSAGQQVVLRDAIDGTVAVGDTVARAIYRVVQEGLTNARKHARHARVAVTLTAEERWIRVTVSNPVAIGVTQDEIPGVGAGLTGLRERVQLEGGTLYHGVGANMFTLDARLPRSER